MRFPNLPKSAVTLAAVVVVLVIAAIGFEALVSAGTPGPGSDEYAVVVTRDGVELGRYTIEDLQGFGVERVVVAGDPQEGPRLLDVLKAAGVREFDTLTISGMAVRDDGFIRLDRGDVTEDVLLDIAVRGTVKVVGPDIAWADRVRDVTRIEVR